MTSVAPQIREARQDNTSPTINRILQAAEQVFAEAGFDAAKMECIAREADISKQLVYHYFGSKTGLYGEVLRSIARANHEALLAIDYENLTPVAAVQAYIETLFDQYYSRSASAMVTIDQSLHAGAQIKWHHDSSAMHETIIARLEKALQRGKLDGSFSQDVTVERFEYMMIIIVSGSVSSRGMFARMAGSRSVAQTDPKDWKQYAVSFVLKALRP